MQRALASGGITASGGTLATGGETADAGSPQTAGASGSAGAAGEAGCGDGVPLTISELEFPDTFSAMTEVGYVDYQGNVEALQSPAFAVRASNGSTTRVTWLDDEFHPVSGCRIAFMVPKPDYPLRGSLALEFRIIDTTCFGWQDPWDCAESNVLTQQVTVM
jgi:hypothetical protein